MRTLTIATHPDHIFAPNAAHAGIGEVSTLERVAGIALLFFATLFTLTGAGFYFVYKAHQKQVAIQQHEQWLTDGIQDFWKGEIQPFYLSHGTSSLYFQHFKEHGISASYPAALSQIVSKIRAVWTAHEHDIARKTGYFRDFEQRYDTSRAHAKIAFSFSANPNSIEEFTRGARNGGEWIREIRNFIRDAQGKEQLLSPEERETLAEMSALITILKLVPPMIVKLNATSGDLRGILWRAGNERTKFFSENLFIDYVKNGCNWRDSAALTEFLIQTRAALDTEKEALQKQYEVGVNMPIPPDALEFEILPQLIPPRAFASLGPKERAWLRTFGCEGLIPVQEPELSLSV